MFVDLIIFATMYAISLLLAKEVDRLRHRIEALENKSTGPT